MSQNLRNYEIKCDSCDGLDFIRSTRMTLGPNGLVERMGDFVCLGCRKKLPTSQAVKNAEFQRKMDELKAMQEEMESMNG